MTSTEVTEATDNAVLAIVREVLGRPAITVNDDLFDHGATSLSFVRVLARIKQTWQVMVNAAELEEVTARALAAQVDRASASAGGSPAEQKIGA